MATRWEITNAVRKSNLPAPARLIMHTLLVIADAGTAEIPPHWTPSLGQLVRETGLTKSTVAKHLKALEETGWVVRIRPETAQALGQGERTRYRLAMPGCPPAALQPLEPSAADEPLVRETDNLVRETDNPSAGDGHRVRSSSDPQIKNKPSSSEPVSDRPDVEQICQHLADRIEANGSNRPNITKTWRDAARRLIDRDGRTVDQILKAIDWCQDNEFWQRNVMSMPTLREKYDRLRLEAQAQRSRASPGTDVAVTNGHKSTTDAKVAQTLALKQKFKGK